MVHADRWAKRPCVMRYRAFGDLLRLLGARLPYTYTVIAYFAMPGSWSLQKRADQLLQPHQSKPDGSNLLKAIEDHLLPGTDQKVWDGRCIKLWALADRTVILDTGRCAPSEALIASLAPTADPR